MEEIKAEKERRKMHKKEGCMDNVQCNLSDLIFQSGHISRGAFLQLEMLRLFQPDVLSVLEPVISQFLHRFCLYLDPFNSDRGMAFLLPW
jgi:hypothetical protein